MDFLDSHDLDVSKKRSRRVRSWYLYEQFKALERNQLDAARQLKDRSYRERVLRRELSERKARRKLYDQFDLSESESGIERSVKSEGTKTSLNVSSDDFFESFHELRDDEDADDEDVHEITDDYSQDDSQGVEFNDDYYETRNCYEEDYKSQVAPNEDRSCEESIKSVVNVKSDNTITNMEKCIEAEKEMNFEDLNLNFDEVKDRLQGLEKMAHLRDYDKVSTTESAYSVEEKETKDIIMKDKNVNTCDNSILLMWSKLVSFAYQLMQLNHGNCYYDYGTQLLTAILACDVLRKGINKMCHILQPYVSPIKFATDSESSIVKSHKNINFIKSQLSRKNNVKKTPQNLNRSKTRMNIKPARKFRSEDFWESNNKNHINIKGKKIDRKGRGASEPWRSKPRSRTMCEPTISSYRTIWPFSDTSKSSSKERCECGRSKVLNPMLKLSRYLDDLMQEIQDPC